MSEPAAERRTTQHAQDVAALLEAKGYAVFARHTVERAALNTCDEASRTSVLGSRACARRRRQGAGRQAFHNASTNSAPHIELPCP